MIQKSLFNQFAQIISHRELYILILIINIVDCDIHVFLILQILISNLNVNQLQVKFNKNCNNSSTKFRSILFQHWSRCSDNLQQQVNMEINQNISKQIIKIMLPLSIICLQILMISLVKTQCCLTFSGRNCLTCPNGTHLFRGSCLNDIEQCLEYTGGFDCIKCASGYHLTNNSCLLWSGQSSSSSQSFTDKFIDYKNITKQIPDHYKIALSLVSSNKSTEVIEPIFGLIRTYSTGLEQIYIQFKKDIKFITAKVQFKQGSPNQQVQYTSSLQPTIPKISIQPKLPQPSIIKASLDQSSVKFVQHTDSSSDQYCLVIMDFISVTNPEYKLLKVWRAGNGDSIRNSYKLTYSNTDGSMWEILANFNSKSYMPVIQKQTQISPPTTLPKQVQSPTFKLIQTSKILTDFYFLIALDQINKQTANKYKEQNIKSVYKLEAQSSIEYKGQFEYGDFLWEVVAQINKNDFTVTNVKQVKKQALTVGASFNNNIQSAANSFMAGNNTNKGTTPSTQSSTNNGLQSNKDVINNMNSGTNSNSIQQLRANPPKIADGDSKTNPTRTDTTKQPTLISSNISLMNSTTTNNHLINNSSVNATTSKSDPSIDKIVNISVIANSEPVKSIPILTNISKNADVGVITNKAATISEGNKKQANYSLPLSILNSVSGLTQVKSSQFSSPAFLKLDLLLRQVNSKQLGGADIIGAYFSAVSFTRNYQIYYQKGFQIYEAKISTDTLRNRTYVLGFNKVS